MARRAIAGIFLLAFGASAEAEVAISVDTQTQRMAVAIDGVPTYQWPVSTGATGYWTPGGAYRPFRLEAEHYSKEWDDAPMPHSIFFTEQGHAIHGTKAVKALGSPASHGCVRLALKNAATLFTLVQRHGLADTTIAIDSYADFLGASDGLQGPDAYRQFMNAVGG